MHSQFRIPKDFFSCFAVDLRTVSLSKEGEQVLDSDEMKCFVSSVDQFAKALWTPHSPGLCCIHQVLHSSDISKNVQNAMSQLQLDEHGRLTFESFKVGFYLDISCPVSCFKAQVHGVICLYFF